MPPELTKVPLMPTLRKKPKAPNAPQVILDEVSPYQSRRVTVEFDGVTSAAYLSDERGAVVAAVWLANHVAAPHATDLGRLNAGQTPVMPAGNTRQPKGTPPFDRGALEVCWFEEGDGVALLESGRPLAVIPGWANADKGMPGYSRDAVEQTPFAWALDEALEGLGPRIERAQAYWRWRRGQGAWGGFQQAVLGHLLNRLGPGAQYWDTGRERLPMVGITERPPSANRPYTVLSTVGMSCQRMPVVEQLVDDARDYGRVELALATTKPSQEAARIFLWLAQYPWRAGTWFGPGHSVRWYHDASTFPLGGGDTGVLLLDDPERLTGPQPPDLSGFTFGGDPVRWLWLVPINEEERAVARQRGSATLITQLTAENRSWVS